MEQLFQEIQEDFDSFMEKAKEFIDKTKEN